MSARRRTLTILWWATAAMIACAARSQLFVSADADLGVDVSSVETSDGLTEAERSDSSTCTLDAGLFRCGDGSCDRRAQECWEIVGGPPPGVDNLSCKDLTVGCCACSCAAFDPKTCFCNEDLGGVHVVCPVP
jgi:hypothetical protein